MLALNTPTVTTKDPGRGGRGRFPRSAGEMSRSDKRGRPACGAARALPLGVFRDDSPTVWGKCHEVTKGDGPRQGYPPKWSFASFSSNKKRKAPGGSGDDSPAGRGKCREATKGDGLRAGGLSRPQRRDLRGLIKYKTVKL